VIPVGCSARVSAEVHQGARHYFPAVGFSDNLEMGLIAPAQVGGVHHFQNGCHQTVHVTWFDKAPQTLALDLLTEHVAPAGDKGQARPKIVQKAGAEGKTTFQMIAVQADTHVRLQQIVGPILR
jgi:hypothetical protein